ncbi:hypothetical protein [Acidiphilium sp.]|uniref:hypothetical protein n=1 Tax=Acidiphilium sp. TaxID=527 RepID=UPI0002F1203A|nr:hypothetical protein [Acidiphilium sp.]
MREAGRAVSRFRIDRIGRSVRGDTIDAMWATENSSSRAASGVNIKNAYNNMYLFTLETLFLTFKSKSS